MSLIPPLHELRRWLALAFRLYTFVRSLHRYYASVSDFPVTCMLRLRPLSSSTGPILDGDRSLPGPPGFCAKSLHACSGSLTPQVRNAARASATYDVAFPTKSQGTRKGDFGAQLPCLHAPCQRFAAHLTMCRRMTRGHGWSLLITM